MILNQKTMPWGNEKLGTSAYYIWAKGCLITELAEILGTTPSVVNQKLNDVGGFAPDASGQVSLVIWKKIPEAFSGISVNRVWHYDDVDVHLQLSSGASVVVEVPADPIGNPGGKHWVRYIGEHKLHDPWTGTERPTSDFPNPTGYAVISGTWDNPANKPAETPPEQAQNTETYQGLDLSNEASVKAAIDTWHAVETGEYVRVEFVQRICEVLGIAQTTDLEAIIEHVATLKRDFAAQVAATVVPSDTQVEGQAPEVAPVVTLVNLPQHEKDAILQHFQNALTEVKKLFGL